MRELQRLPHNFIMDGEVCTLDAQGRPDVEAMAVRRNRRLRYTYFAFDLLWLDGQDLRASPLIERKAMLRKLLPRDNFTIRYVDHIETHGEQMYAYVLKEHLEGVVAKKANSPYVSGANSYWYKFKIPNCAVGFQRKRKEEGSNKPR